jgi:hypothetical protein
MDANKFVHSDDEHSMKDEIVEEKHEEDEQIVLKINNLNYFFHS